MFLSSPQLNPAAASGLRRRWFGIIFWHEPGWFDLLLIGAILVSVLAVLAVLLDSVAAIHLRWYQWLLAIEWFFTLLFTVEYVARLWVVRKPLRYALSSWGVIDLLSILPTYISLLLPGGQALMVVRILRVFRILKLTQYLAEGNLLVSAMLRSRRKIFLFVSALLTIIMIFSALMYLIEGPEYGSLASHQHAVGGGDHGHRGLRRHLSGNHPGAPGDLVLILIGYSIITVPTGIYTAELANTLRDSTTTHKDG